MEQQKCDDHSKEIIKIKTNFDNFKMDISRQLEEIKEQLKPYFTE